ncbi:putative methyl-accepting chemotaxis sensory transducer [Catenovulum agarivorans DS-2]|uniref:Putative methyl-accepting chemotaxis sensory transducer n=1 Tax=Catenovulum agarivorans DS-2 TaxID=1328313 RepID=W7QJN6_9ALTE|nr:methyl-accepting chemotaxis protein [Catenovulum agarivorans]EWH09177.1 putative methyl-accepting chemotaxis sensory transducer [Catenovulum agarivorans DS-2]
MKWLNNIKIQTRIILLVLIPLIVVLTLCMERLNQAKQVQSNMQDVEFALDFVQLVSPLISHLQQERELTRLYLGPGTPDHPVGREYKQDAEQARKRAIQSQQKFISFLQANDAKLQRLPQLAQQVKAALFNLEQFTLVREVASKRLKSENAELAKKFKRPIWVLEEYGRMIKSLLYSLDTSLQISTSDKELGKLANAFSSLVYSIELSIAISGAVDTAIGSNLFVHLYGTIASLDAQLVRAEYQFEKFADKELRDFYNSKLKNSKENKLAFANYRKIRNAADKIGKPWQVSADEWKTNTEGLAASYQDVAEFMLTKIAELKEVRVAQANDAVMHTWVLIVGLIIVICLVSFAIIYSVAKPLKAMVSEFSIIAKDKDMQRQIQYTGKDELAALVFAFNNLLENFNSTLTGVKNQATSIDSTSGQVAEAMNQSLTLSASQLQATDSVAVAVNEMTATIEEVSSMAQQTSSAVENAHQVSVQSAEKAELSRQMMESLTHELGTTSEVVNALNEEASHISSILNVIQGIAEQINLLALNAAIEAARAGEQGRGFSVVADEVRSLAGRTQESTEQIRNQIESLLAGAEAASSKMVTLQQEGHKAVEVVIESSSAFDVMKAELDNIMQMAVQIATASEEQTCVSNEINQRILAIRDDAEKVTAHANTTVESTSSLGDSSVQLQSYINEFQLAR